MPRRRGDAIRLGGSLAAVTACIAALAASVAYAQSAPAAVWYRSAGDCPDGAAFIARLAARNVPARLAQVGDAIDFVVTLGAGADGHSSGVLERQAQTGTVAIRRVDDARCDLVADALALTLALSLEARAVQPTGAEQDAPVTGEQAAPLPMAASETAPSPPVAAATTPSPPPPPPALATRDHDPIGDWVVVADALAATGIAPDLMAGAAAAVGFELGGTTVWRPALRLGGLGAFGSGASQGETLRLQLLAGRLEACPLAFGTRALTARPCVALDLGQLRGRVDSEGARSDSGFWAAIAGAARVTWWVAGPLALELQAGLGVPLTRYTLRSSEDARTVHRTAAVGFNAGLGAAVRIP